MAATLKPSEVLAKAADLIEPEGAWCQYAMSNYRGARCLIGALEEVTPRGMDWDAVTDPIRLAVRARYLIAWNDKRGRTQAEAVSALRKASELAKAGRP